MRHWKPSPPPMLNQSLVRMPARFTVRDGPSTDAVVLRAAADVVERPRVVGRDPVELRQRQVGELPPGLHAVVGLVQRRRRCRSACGGDRSDPTRPRDGRRARRSAAPSARSCRRPRCARCWSRSNRSSPGSRDRRRSRCSSRDRRRGSSRRWRRRGRLGRPCSAFRAAAGGGVGAGAAAPMGPQAAGGAVFAPEIAAASALVDAPADTRPARARIVRAEESALRRAARSPARRRCSGSSD